MDDISIARNQNCLMIIEAPKYLSIYYQCKEKGILIAAALISVFMVDSKEHFYHIANSAF